MNNNQEVIALQTWWLGEIKRITKKVMDEESRRVERVRVKNAELLAEYNSEGEIIDAYGYGFITEKQKDKLLDLWQKVQDGSEPTSLHERKIKLLQEMYEQAKQVIRDTEIFMGTSA